MNPVDRSKHRSDEIVIHIEDDIEFITQAPPGLEKVQDWMTFLSLENSIRDGKQVVFSANLRNLCSEKIHGYVLDQENSPIKIPVSHRNIQVQQVELISEVPPNLDSVQDWMRFYGLEGSIIYGRKVELSEEVKKTCYEVINNYLLEKEKGEKWDFADKWKKFRKLAPEATKKWHIIVPKGLQEGFKNKYLKIIANSCGKKTQLHLDISGCVRINLEGIEYLKKANIVELTYADTRLGGDVLEYIQFEQGNKSKK